MGLTVEQWLTQGCGWTYLRSRQAQAIASSDDTRLGGASAERLQRYIEQASALPKKCSGMLVRMQGRHNTQVLQHNAHTNREAHSCIVPR